MRNRLSPPPGTGSSDGWRGPRYPTPRLCRTNVSWPDSVTDDTSQLVYTSSTGSRRSDGVPRSDHQSVIPTRRGRASRTEHTPRSAVPSTDDVCLSTSCVYLLGEGTFTCVSRYRGGTPRGGGSERGERVDRRHLLRDGGRGIYQYYIQHCYIIYTVCAEPGFGPRPDAKRGARQPQ